MNVEAGWWVIGSSFNFLSTFVYVWHFFHDKKFLKVIGEKKGIILVLIYLLIPQFLRMLMLKFLSAIPILVYSYIEIF